MWRRFSCLSNTAIDPIEISIGSLAFSHNSHFKSFFFVSSSTVIWCYIFLRFYYFVQKKSYKLQSYFCYSDKWNGSQDSVQPNGLPSSFESKCRQSIMRGSIGNKDTPTATGRIYSNCQPYYFRYFNTPTVKGSIGNWKLFFESKRG